MHKRTIGGLLVAALALTAACGGDEAGSIGTTAPATPVAGAGSAVAVTAGDTALGEILVGEGGMTLYGFTNDIDGVSTCSGTCADAWPPVIVGPDWAVGPGLDSGVFSTVERDDGTKQLVAGKWPLYYYSGDSAPGDVNGQGSGDVWFVVGTDAVLVDEAAPEGAAVGAAVSVQVADSALGEIVVDGDGNTLYGFTDDTDGAPTCAGGCATTWPAHLVEGDPGIGAGLDPATFSVVEGPEGGQQLVAGPWPLYRFSGDSAPGDVNGQGSGGAWFVVAPDGSLIKDAPGGGSGGGSGGGEAETDPY